MQFCCATKEIARDSFPRFRTSISVLTLQWIQGSAKSYNRKWLAALKNNGAINDHGTGDAGISKAIHRDFSNPAGACCRHDQRFRAEEIEWLDAMPRNTVTCFSLRRT